MRLIQISAWNDSGGGFLHRLLDGHPELRAWPFELLLGEDNRPVDRFDESWFRGRYRWPRLGDAVAAAESDHLFDRISDAELKGALVDPRSSKHRGFDLPVTLAAWRAEVGRRWAAVSHPTQAAFISTYVDSFFFLLDGREDSRTTLGHCPVAVIDAPETWADFPGTRFLCVIRSPLSGFADMRRRHPTLDPVRYAAKWSMVNAASAMWAHKAPDRVRLIHLDQLLTNRERTLRALCDWLKLRFEPCILTPTWRGYPLNDDSMGPFGGVPSISAHREATLAGDLDASERTALVALTRAVDQLDAFAD